MNMFLAHRPSARAIERFLRDAPKLPLSYGPVGLVDEEGGTGRIDEAIVPIGRGEDDYERARAALRAWRQFDVGWIELYPRDAGVDVGTDVAVLIRHLGFWSLNGCRIVYGAGDRWRGTRFGYAYGTLTSHAEAGEELFDVSLDPRSGAVTYRIRAASRGHALLARVGMPIVRLLQARFRRDSAAAMRRAVTR